MSKKLYVGNLPFSVTDDSLHQKFAEIGGVESAKIVTDRETGRSKGFGFVEMASEDEANKAIDGLNGKDFLGRNMSVALAKPQAPRDSRGPRSGGGFGGGRGPRSGGGGFGGGRGSRYD